MKQILISLSIIGVVGALVIGGTIAHLRDDERVVGNIFQAGYINLQLGDNHPPGVWGDGARYTWRTLPNWAPGETVAQVLYLRNYGNINAVRLTMGTTVTVTTNAARAADAGVPDETDMDTRIIVTRMIYAGTDLLATTTADFVNADMREIDANDNQIITLHELSRKTLNLPGINAEQATALDMEFTFDSTAGSGYMGDRVNAEFIFGLRQI